MYKSIRKDYKMRNLHSLYLLLVFAMILSGCGPSDSIIKPTSTQTQPPLPTLILPTSTPTPRPTQTATLTPPATLQPEQAKNAIRALLQGPDCPAPCFWGIIPGQTTFGEAKNIFTYLGLQLKHTNTQNNEDFYALIYDLDSGLRVSPVLTIQNELVKNIEVGINPERRQVGVPREWLAYSPETLIKRYGPPTKVGFFVGRGAPQLSYAMNLYFNAVNLIVEYGGYDVGVGPASSFRICPLIDQSDNVRVWLGPNPEHPPLDAVPLEKATSLTMDEFSKLMTGTPQNACINLKKEMFP